MLLYVVNLGELVRTEFFENLEEALVNSNGTPVYKADIYKSRISISETGKISYEDNGKPIFKSLPVM